jgi:NAD(P)-dependent dehydrogenase (short-subunit alcohol dehydrogenase family)
MLIRNRKRGATVIALRRRRQDAAAPAPVEVLHPARERAEVIDLSRARVRRMIEDFEPQGGDAA